MLQRRIPVGTTATACLMTLLLAGPAVVDAKVLYSNIVATENETDVFYCGFFNIHQKNDAVVSFLIWDFVSQEVTASDSFVLPANFSSIRSVTGPGVYQCVIETKGGKVQSQISLGT